MSTKTVTFIEWRITSGKKLNQNNHSYCVHLGPRLGRHPVSHPSSSSLNFRNNQRKVQEKGLQFSRTKTIWLLPKFVSFLPQQVHTLPPTAKDEDHRAEGKPGLNFRLRIGIKIRISFNVSIMVRITISIEEGWWWNSPLLVLAAPAKSFGMERCHFQQQSWSPDTGSANIYKWWQVWWQHWGEQLGQWYE